MGTSAVATAVFRVGYKIVSIAAVDNHGLVVRYRCSGSYI